MMSQAKQKQKTISEAARKLLERLNEIYQRYKKLVEEKEKLIREYNQRLLQIEAEITDIYAEAARIIDELERDHGLRIEDIKPILKSVPDEFFRDVARIRRKKVDKKQLEQAIRKTYEELMEEESAPAIFKALRRVQPAPPSITRLERLKEARDKFICPFCGEEHDREAEQATITICRHCQAFLETWLIPNRVFEGHGAPFLTKWRNVSDRVRRLSEVEKAYRNLLKYLKNRGITVPEELLVPT